MILKPLIGKMLKKAFALAGDLTTTVILNKATTSGFDFNTLDPNVTSGSSLTVKALVSKRKKTKDNLEIIEILLVSEDVIPLSDYDTLTFEGKTWHISPASFDDGYTILVEIVRQ